MPRWYGKEGEWQKFATEAANKISGEEGDVLYARIGWSIRDDGIYEGFLRDAGCSWPRLRKGLEIIIKNNPDSVGALNQLAYFLSQKRDQPGAEPLFQAIGGRAVEDIWDTKERFLQSRNWALQISEK